MHTFNLFSLGLSLAAATLACSGGSAGGAPQSDAPLASASSSASIVNGCTAADFAANDRSHVDQATGTPDAVDARFARGAFAPRCMRVSRGALISWANGDAACKIVVQAGGPDDGGLALSKITEGDSAYVMKVGTYGYACKSDPKVTGGIEVVLGEHGGDMHREAKPEDINGCSEADFAANQFGGLSPDVRFTAGAFSPRCMRVTLGTKVSWANGDAPCKIVVQAGGPADGGLALSSLTEGDSAYMMKAGIYGFACKGDLSATGAIEVQDKLGK